MPTSETRTARYLLLAVLVLGALIRLPLLDNYHIEGMGRDAAGYMKLAESFATGQGWVNHSVRYLYDLPDAVPYPDSYWSPLFPFLIGVLFAAFGVSFGVAQIVPLSFGLMVPPLVAGLSFELTRSRVAALVAGVLAAVHPTLVMWSCRVQPEIVSVFFVTLALWLLLREDRRAKPLLLGVVIGLAYLAKYQNGALLVPVGVYYLGDVPRRQGWLRMAQVAGVFAVTISPWLIRNALVFGDPTFSAVGTGLISYYPAFGGEGRFVASLQPPPNGFAYILSHPREAYALASSSVHGMVLPFLREQTGSVFLVPIAMLGVVVSWRFGRRAAALIAFALFLVAFFAVTTPLVRYLFVLIPVWIAFVAAGGVATVAASPRRGSGWRAATVAAVSVVLGLGASLSFRDALAGARDRAGLWTPTANFGALEALSVAAYVRENTAPGECVLTAETYHYAWFLDRCAIQIPFDEATLRILRDRYRVRYMVTSLRDLRGHLPGWEHTPPDWVTLVRVIPAAEIARPPANRDYAHVSEMRVYRFNR